MFLSYPAVLLALLCILKCSGLNTTVEVAGGTEIPNQIVGHLRDLRGTPIPNAVASLLTITPEIPAGVEIVAEDTTDQTGAYCFENIARGRYRVSATSTDAGLVLLTDAIAVDDSVGIVHTRVDTLVPAATVTARNALHLPAGFTAIVHLVPSPVSVEIGDASLVMLSGIAPGAYRLDVYVRNDANGALQLVSGRKVTVTAGEALNLDSLTIRPLGSPGDTILLGDFSDSDNISIMGQPWWSLDDRDSGGTSTVSPLGASLSLIDSTEGQIGLHLVYELGPSQPVYCGIATLLGDSTRPMAVDLTQAQKMSFKLKGTAGSFRGYFSTNGLIDDATAYFALNKAVPPDWTEYTLTFATAIKNAYPADDLRHWNTAGRFVQKLVFEFTASPSTAGEVWLADVRIYY